MIIMMGYGLNVTVPTLCVPIRLGTRAAAMPGGTLHARKEGIMALRVPWGKAADFEEKAWSFVRRVWPAGQSERTRTTGGSNGRSIRLRRRHPPPSSPLLPAHTINGLNTQCVNGELVVGARGEEGGGDAHLLRFRFPGAAGRGIIPPFRSFPAINITPSHLFRASRRRRRSGAC